MKSDEVKRRERVALQMFWIASAIEVNFPPSSSSANGTSCIIAATIASGPSRINIRRRSSLDGNRRVRNWICVIYT
jgi:hypothetical protein